MVQTQYAPLTFPCRREVIVGTLNALHGTSSHTDLCQHRLFQVDKDTLLDMGSTSSARGGLLAKANVEIGEKERPKWTRGRITREVS